MTPTQYAYEYDDRIIGAKYLFDTIQFLQIRGLNGWELCATVKLVDEKRNPIVRYFFKRIITGDTR